MFSKVVSISFFTMRCGRNFFFTGKSVWGHWRWIVFSTRVCSGKLMFDLIYSTFLKINHAFPHAIHILQEILHGLHKSATKNFMTDLYSSFDYPAFWIISKNDFCYKPYFKQYSVHIHGKKIWKKLFCNFFRKRPLFYWINHIHIYIHIYIL